MIWVRIQGVDVTSHHSGKPSRKRSFDMLCLCFFNHDLKQDIHPIIYGIVRLICRVAAECILVAHIFSAKPNVRAEHGPHKFHQRFRKAD